MNLWRSAPHEYGPGKIHALKDDADETRCGKDWPSIPGLLIDGDIEDITCQLCARSLVAEEQQREREARWHAERAERVERDAQWWRDYDAYLQSPEWAERRRRVLRRAGGICEGCLTNRATQVHHLTYARVRAEMLFDLVAICGDCHERIHER